MRCVAMPAHNEADTMFTLVRGCFENGADRVVVADDSSTDSTADCAREAGAVVMPVPRDRLGMVGVYTTALRAALAQGAQVVVEMDAGGSHNPRELARFWRALETPTVDVAAGRRFGPGATYAGHWKRELLSRGGTWLTNRLHGTHFADATSGYIAYRAPALAALLAQPWTSRGHYYQTEVRLRARDLGLNVVEVPITYKNSGSSLNGASIREALRLAFG